MNRTGCKKFQNQSGFNLVELTIFIVVTSIAMVGVLSVFQNAGSKTAQSFEQKRALEAAQMILEEVTLMPFGYCEPTDPRSAMALSEADCDIVQGFGPNLGQTRGGANPFNHIKDYHGYTQQGITDINGNSIVGLGSWSLKIEVENVTVGNVPNTEVLRIRVSVENGSGVNSMYGYKTRYAPN